MISRVEWLRKYAIYEGCRRTCCSFHCDKCEYEEGSDMDKLLNEAAEIFKMQIMLNGTTHATPL